MKSRRDNISIYSLIVFFLFVVMSLRVILLEVVDI